MSQEQNSQDINEEVRITEQLTGVELESISGGISSYCSSGAAGIIAGAGPGGGPPDSHEPEHPSRRA